MAQVKRDNREIASLESRLADLKSSMNDLGDELTTWEDEKSLDKYRALQSKEQTMKQFLGEYETSQAQEVRRYDNAVYEINSTAGRVSRALAHWDMLHDGLQRDSMAAGASGSALSSTASLLDEQRKMELDLNKIDQLEEKINTELDSLRKSIAELEKEIGHYSDIPKLKGQLEESIKQLTDSKTTLGKRREALEKQVKEASKGFSQLEDELGRSETYKRVVCMERDLADLLGLNKSLQETIQQGASHTLRAQVLDEVKRYNQKLIGY